MIGQLLTGRYLILEQLGSGGFSETYLARDKYLPQHPLCVAKCLKLSPNNTIPLATAQRLFETEAQVLAELGQYHGQIPTLLAYSHDQTVAYQIQQYVEGTNLGQAVASGQRLTSEAAIALLLEVLPVLEYVHSHQIVHRDIKPSNLIQAKSDNKIVLIDFGAACRLVKTPAGWKPDGEDADLAIGTPGYMPKEQQLGHLHFSSDLYALGASIIFLLTGIHPRKLERNPISGELDWQVHFSDRPLHPGLATVLARMTRATVSDRYQSAAEVLQAMQSFVWSESTAPPAKSRRLRFPRRTTMQRLWSRLFGRSLLATGVMASLVVGGYWYVQSQPSGASILPIQLGKNRSHDELALLHSIPITAPIKQLMIAPGDRRLVTASGERQLQVWSLPEGKLLQTLPTPAPDVLALTVSANGKWLVSGGSDRAIHLWDLASGQYLRQFGGHSGAVTAVAVSPDGQAIASGSQDGTVRVWNCHTGIRKQTLARYGSAITAITYGATPDTVISANSRHELQIWNLRTGQLQRTFAGHTAPILRLQMLDSEKLVSVATDRTLVWNLSREELVQSSAHQSPAIVAASVGNGRVVWLNHQGSLQTWNPEVGKSESVLASKLQSSHAALSPTADYVVSWNAGQPLTLWQRVPQNKNAKSGALFGFNRDR